MRRLNRPSRGSLPVMPSADNRAMRHVVTMFRMAGVALGGRQPTDIEVHDARLFSLIYRRGEGGLRTAEALGWWSCADPARMYGRLRLARHNGGSCWSLQGPAGCPPSVTLYRRTPSAA